MKLSEIKGKKQFKVVGKLMTLANDLQDDKEFKKFLQDAANGSTKAESLLKLGHILERDDVIDRIMDILSYAKGVEPDDIEDPLGEIMELLSEDNQLPAFLS